MPVSIGLPGTGADEQDHQRQLSNAGTSTSDSAENPAAKQYEMDPSSRAKGRGHRGLRGSNGRAGERKSSGNNRGQSQRAEAGRGVYSFCMCPGGQIVPTTTNHDELCINGMSFRHAQHCIVIYFCDTLYTIALEELLSQ